MPTVHFQLKEHDRNILTKVWLALMLISRVFFLVGSLAAIFVLNHPAVSSFLANAFPSLPFQYAYPILWTVALITTLEIAFVSALFYYQKWAFYGLAATTAVRFGLGTFAMTLLSMSIGSAFFNSLLNVLSVGILYVLIRTKLK